MHIGLIVSYGLSGSGSTVYNLELARELSKSNEVSLFCHEQRIEEPEQHGELIEDTREYLKYKVTNSLHIYSLRSRFTPVLYNRPEIYNGIQASKLTQMEIQTYRTFCIKTITTITKENPVSLFVTHHLNVQCLIGSHFAQEYKIPFFCIVHGTGIEYGLKKSKHLQNLVYRIH